MMLAPQTLHAQSVNIEGLDSLRLSGSISVVEPELLKKGVLHNALDALSGQTAGVNVTTNGLDRIAMLIANESSIREVIAFPKNNKGSDMMTDSPTTIDFKTLREIYIQSTFKDH